MTKMVTLEGLIAACKIANIDYEILEPPMAPGIVLWNSDWDMPDGTNKTKVVVQIHDV